LLMIKRLHWPIVLSLFLDGIAGNFASYRGLWRNGTEKWFRGKR
jgi:hypothetical protein